MVVCPSSPFRRSGLRLPTLRPWSLSLVPPSHSSGLGAAARPESPVPAHYHCSHLYCNPTPAFQRAAWGCPHHPPWSVSRLRDKPQAGASVLRFLPGKVCPQGALACWEGHGPFPWGSSLNLTLSVSSSYLFALCPGLSFSGGSPPQQREDGGHRVATIGETGRRKNRTRERGAGERTEREEQGLRTTKTKMLSRTPQ